MLKDKIRLGMWQLFEFSFLLLGTSWQEYSLTLLSDLSSLLGISVSKLGLFKPLLRHPGQLPHHTLWGFSLIHCCNFWKEGKDKFSGGTNIQKSGESNLKVFLSELPYQDIVICWSCDSSTDSWSSGLFSIILLASFLQFSCYFPFFFSNTLCCGDVLFVC